MEFLKDLFHFMRTRKKWWLLPLIAILLLLGLFLIATSNAAVASFIYTIF